MFDVGISRLMTIIPVSKIFIDPKPKFRHPKSSGCPSVRHYPCPANKRTLCVRCRYVLAVLSNRRPSPCDGRTPLPTDIHL